MAGAGVALVVNVMLLAGCWGLPSLPMPVTGVQASATVSTVSLNWTNPPMNYWGARVYRTEGSTPPTGPDDGELVGDAGDSGAFTDRGLAPDSTYSYAVIAYGADGYSSTPATITVTTTIATAISAGYQHSCALLADGTVECWGRNGNGQLGDGTTNDSSSPVAVSGISTATAITTGNLHSCALLADGTLRCWGRNADGELGDGTSTTSSIPVTPTGISTATAITAGQHHSCARLADGTLRCWGYNAGGSSVTEPTPTRRPR